ncbi:MotE family protein [Paenibacillus sp. GCM10023252]|uniref:MotE family protein n=1 Tax=Paenibacillus sp. GCM10023252 TaxID=3252649 RepID=UPI003613E559
MEMEKQGYSGFERFMFFVTPILFTLVLLGVLLTLFNYDIRNKALEIGNQIPLLSDMLPEPQAASGVKMDDSELKTGKLSELQAALTVKERALNEATAAKAKLDQSVKELQSEIDQLKRVNDEQVLEDEQYQAKVQDLASMYAKINPSKAAPILESMTLPEMVLVLDAMKSDDRVRILEKMNPKTAADATIMLKDTVTVKDRQIAALQARLIKQQPSKAMAASSTLDQEQLSQTFTSMDAESAGQLLITMANVSPSKVLRILNAVNNETRSSILSEMSAINESITAQLVTKLMNGN